MSNAARIDRLERNLIINGNFDLFQRNSISVAAATNRYVADRFKIVQFGSPTAVYTVAASGNVPTPAQSNFQSTNSLNHTVTTLQASMAAGDAIGALYVIEGYDFARLQGKSCVLSFWVNSSITGTYSVSFQNSSGASYVTTYTIAAANVWQKVSIVIAMSAASIGTWAYDTGIGLQIFWALACGTTNKTSTLNSWTASGSLASTGQVNHAATNGATFRISQVMFNEGIVAGDFSRAGIFISREQALAERYLQQLMHLPGNVNTGNTGFSVYTQFRQQMVKTPTISQTGLLNVQSGGTSLNSTQNSLGFGSGIVDSKSAIIQAINFPSMTLATFGFLAVPGNNGNFILADADF